MKTYNDLNKWAVQKLIDFGFSPSLKKIVCEDVVVRPLANQSLNNKEEWAAFYHLFEQEGEVILYMYNKRDNQARIDRVMVELSLNDILLTKEYLSADEIIDESKKESLNDPKFLKEQMLVANFIEKAALKKENKLPKNEKLVESLSVSHVDNSGSKSEESSTENHDVYKNCSTEKLTSVVEKLNQLNRIEGIRALDANSVFAKAYGLSSIGDVFITDKQLTLIVFDKTITLHEGQLLIRLSNKKHDLLAVAELNDKGELIKSFTISPRDSNINCYLIGNKNVESNKWLFLSADWLSAMIIKNQTGIDVLVCETKEYPIDLLSDLRSRNPALKIGVFIDGILSINQKLQLEKTDTNGVYHFYIDADFKGEPVWRSFITEKLKSSAEDMKTFVKTTVQKESTRVNQLQFNS